MVVEQFAGKLGQALDVGAVDRFHQRLAAGEVPVEGARADPGPPDDLIQRLRLPVILVARAGVGTLNHTALSHEALSRRGLEVAAVVLNRTAAEDDPTVASNPRWVARMTGARVVGPAPFLPDPEARVGALCAVLDPLVDTSPVRR